MRWGAFRLQAGFRQDVVNVFLIVPHDAVFAVFEVRGAIHHLHFGSRIIAVIIIGSFGAFAVISLTGKKEK